MNLIPIMVDETALKAARDELDEYPSSYDAHRDGLNERWDHEEAVNRLLKTLRRLLAEVR